jgi:hypothetical protein
MRHPTQADTALTFHDRDGRQESDTVEGIEQIVRERRVERAPLLSGRSSRHGGQGVELRNPFGHAMSAREEDSSFSARSGASGHKRWSAR